MPVRLVDNANRKNLFVSLSFIQASRQANHSKRAYLLLGGARPVTRESFTSNQE